MLIAERSLTNACHVYTSCTDGGLGVCIIIIDTEGAEMKFCVHVQKLKAMSMFFTEALPSNIDCNAPVPKIRVPFEVRPELMSIFTEFIYLENIEEILQRPAYSEMDKWDEQVLRLELYMLGLRIGSPRLCLASCLQQENLHMNLLLHVHPEALLKYEETFNILPVGDVLKMVIADHIAYHFLYYRLVIGGMDEFVSRSPALVAAILRSNVLCSHDL